MTLESSDIIIPNIRFVQIQTHSRCNADCVFCPYIESAHADRPGFMTDALWNKVMENLLPFKKSIETGKICPYLMQEPLIDKTIFPKIDDIYHYFPNTTVEVSTNGAALTEKVAEKLIRCVSGKKHEIWISHHGIDSESIDHIMKIDFKKAHRNLVNFLKQANGQLKIRIRGAGQSRDGKFNYFSKSDYHDYWDKLFTEHNINTNGVNVNYFTFHDRAGTLHRIDRGANQFNIGKVRELGPEHPEFYCTRLDQWLHIMYDGQVRICCMDYHGEVQLPNINDMSILDYYQSDEYRKLSMMVRGKSESPDNFICKRCVSPGG